MANIAYIPFTSTVKELSKAVILNKGVTALFYSTKNYKKRHFKPINIPVQLNIDKKIELLYKKRLAEKVQVACFVFQAIFYSVGCRGPPSEFWILNQNSKFGGKTNGKQGQIHNQLMWTSF